MFSSFARFSSNSFPNDFSGRLFFMSSQPYYSGRYLRNSAVLEIASSLLQCSFGWLCLASPLRWETRNWNKAAERTERRSVFTRAVIFTHNRQEADIVFLSAAQLSSPFLAENRDFLMMFCAKKEPTKSSIICTENAPTTRVFNTYDYYL